MHICHLILTHSFAGSERYAIELANAQSEAHQVSVILHQRGCEQRPNALAYRLSDNVTVFPVRGPKWWASMQARRLVRQLRPDVAHAHLSAACKALKNVDGPSRVASLHIHYKPNQHAHMDGLIAIAPWQLEAIPKALRRRSVQLDNWTCAQAQTGQAREQQREAWGIAEGEFIFGTLGRVEPSKGHDILLKAFARLDAPQAKLVIVGDGSALPRLRRDLPSNLVNRVIFAGYQAQPERCLAAFDGFVSAARTEPFGLVFLEAMVAGLPLAATASQGACYLQPYFQYPLAPVDDEARLADAMQAMFDHGPQHLVHELSRFDYAQQTQRVTQYYQDLAQGYHGGES